MLYTLIAALLIPVLTAVEPGPPLMLGPEWTAIADARPTAWRGPDGCRLDWAPVADGAPLEEAAATIAADYRFLLADAQITGPIPWHQARRLDLHWQHAGKRHYRIILAFPDPDGRVKGVASLAGPPPRLQALLGTLRLFPAP